MLPNFCQFLARGFLLILLLALFLTGCVPSGDLIAPVEAESQAPVSASSTGSAPPIAATLEAVAPAAPNDDPAGPQNIARQFFQAYLESQEKNQPAIGSAEFTAQQYLSQEYLAQYAEIQAGFDGPSFDPVFQTQMTPPQPVEVKEFSVDGSRATVIIQFGKGVIDPHWERLVSLEQIDGRWQIVPDRFEGGGKTPAETVDTFYNWYLGYIGVGEQARNPLVDRAYRAAPYLDTPLVADTDRLLEKGIQSDPFLCAQDVPTEVRAVASFYNAARPVVVAQTSFPNHFLVLDLARVNFNKWAIRKITCASTPEGTAKAFFAWALGYSTRDGERHNPWVDGAYCDSPFLSKTFIQNLDSQLASGEGLAADPVFFAQDIPQAFNTARCTVPNCALVNTQYGDANIQQLRLTLKEEDGRLRIGLIRPVEGAQSPQPAEPLAGVEEWSLLQDEQYGYAVRYPLAWRIKGVKVTDLHTVEEYNRMRSISFFAPGVRQYIAVGLDVVIGDAQSVFASYGFSEQGETKQVNGYPMSVYRAEPGIIYYVFQHPSRPDTWLIFCDAITQFPGREEMVKEVEGVIDRMISTIAFTE